MKDIWGHTSSSSKSRHHHHLKITEILREREKRARSICYIYIYVVVVVRPVTHVRKHIYPKTHTHVQKKYTLTISDISKSQRILRKKNTVPSNPKLHLSWKKKKKH